MKRSFKFSAVFATLLIATQLNPAFAARTTKDKASACNDVVNEGKSKSGKAKPEKIAQADVNWYFKFVKKNLRMPSAAEIKEADVAKLSVKQLFGSWGRALDEANPGSLRGGAIDSMVKDALLSRDQVESIVDVFYKKLKIAVRELSTYPPSAEQFGAFLGHQGKNFGMFTSLFDKDEGLFSGYNEGFKNNSTRWKNHGSFFNAYPDRTIFTDRIKTLLTEDISNAPALYVAGYVSGQPIAPGVEVALTNLQKESRKNYGKTLPVLTAPAYGVASGIPDTLNNPKEHRYVSPQSVFLQESPGNVANINKIALPNRALIPATGLNKVMSPGETMVVVHPQSVFTPISSDTEYPSAVVTTGAINEKGANYSARPIGARISAIQNDLHSSSVIVLEKLTGTDQEKGLGLEAHFRPRSLPFLDRETTVDLGDGTLVTYPPGFADLNKLYGVDGKVYDLPIYTVVFGDTHYPMTDRSYLENFFRQFIDPETGLKRVDGKPVDIFSFVFNDHFNGDWFSSYTEKDLSAKQALSRDPRENNLELHLRGGAEIQKDLQMAVERTRGYVPNVFYMHSNHDSDRLRKKLSTGSYINDVANAAAYTRLKVYSDQHKDAFREYLMNDIGVSYNDHVHVLSPGEPLVISNAAISHGHMGGVFGKPVPMVGRRAAQGSAINGHSHVALEANQIYNAGHAAMDLEYAKGWFKQGYQAVVIRTPIHTQVLFYKDGSFYGTTTHSNPELEFRAGFPNFKPLPVDTQQVKNLPGQANSVDQYR